ncbi:MAG: DMT family transporter [Comamonadaceae bacterium]|nr:DMT family transporter [Comamonadaceae bacterium]
MALVRATSSHLAAIGFVTAAVACFAALDTTTKAIAALVPLAMAVWFRYLFQALATALVLWPGRGRAMLATAHPWLQIARGALLTLSSTLAFLSLRFMPVGEFTAIVMLTPLVVTVLAATSLGERVPALRWLLLAGGFAGALLVIRPGGQDFHLATLLPLGMVATNAAFQALTSRLARTEDAATMHLWTGCTGTVLTALALPFTWQTLSSPWLWAVLVLLGVLGSGGRYLLILAFSRAPVALLTPYLYAQVGFATLFGMLAFGHRPDAWGWAGLLLIALCGVLGTRLGVPRVSASAAAPRWCIISSSVSPVRRRAPRARSNSTAIIITIDGSAITG